MISRLIVALALLASVARADDRDQMRLFDDGKHHVLAYLRGDTPDHARWAYGTTTELTLLRVAHKTVTPPRNIWHFDDPRYFARTTDLVLDDGTATVTCGTRPTTFRASGAKLTAKAALEPARWREPAYLARDATAVYYYVDRPQNAGTDPRLYIGKRGSLLEQKLTDVASDSAGLLLVTKRGSFRYNRGPDTFEWIGTDHKAMPLTAVHPDYDLIYNELGVYAGHRMGTPCDDL